VGNPQANQSASRKQRTLILSLVLTIAFVAIEAAAGYWSGSLALISDAGHNLTDAFGLGLAAMAVFFQNRPGNQRKTYGYQRTEVLAAFVNALVLVVVSAWLLWESYVRLRNPEPIQETAMLAVAALGLVVNLGIAKALGGHGHDLNVKAAVLHQMGDAASCVGIILGAIVIRYSGWLAIDPLLSIVIGLVIIWTAWDIFRDSLNILLEGLPKGVTLAEVTKELNAVAGVIDVHDLHIWSLGSEVHALSCHVLIEDMPPSASDSILRQMNRMLCQRFAIDHTTIQFEHARCALADETCTAVQHDHSHHHHHHH
jgi:cobalt-zinc-cadmium efflux system protein